MGERAKIIADPDVLALNARLIGAFAEIMRASGYAISQAAEAKAARRIMDDWPHDSRADTAIARALSEAAETRPHVATPAGMAETPPGMAWDRASKTFVPVEEMARREQERAERRFMRRLNQGAVPTPQIMRDFRHMEPTRMTDGTIVTSRAEKRAYQERTGLVDYEPIQHERDHWTTDYAYRENLAKDVQRAMQEDPINWPSKERQWEDAGFKGITEVERMTMAAAPPEAPSADAFVDPPKTLAAQG